MTDETLTTTEQSGMTDQPTGTMVEPGPAPEPVTSEPPAPVVPMPTMPTPEAALIQAQQQAEHDIDWYYGTGPFVQKDGTNAANQALIYAVKGVLALLAKLGIMEPDQSLLDEAAIREIPVEQLIEEIVGMGRKMSALELARLSGKIGVRKATSVKDVILAEIEAGIPISMINVRQ